ncbi:unnamed protein product [Cylicocyclus nassatus]|uniref:G protein-coupled receptor n=1 Tax=Cylicocyclus nassatus TaxID=53992 RepID=A0AA36DSG3_CYLNA|nr:unnamed protein product [Cylicocyclus nassatus]
MNVPRLHIYTSESIRPFLITSIVLLVLGAPLMATIIWSSYHYLNQRGNLSQRTRNMQRRFLYYVYIQASIPGLCLFIPLFIFMLTMITSSMSVQGIVNIAMGGIALHGLVSSVSMVLCNEPYRRFALNLSRRVLQVVQRGRKKHVIHISGLLDPSSVNRQQHSSSPITLQ